MLIGVGGLSRSGKTKLAKRIRTFFAEKKVCLLHQDDFVKAESEIPLIRDHIDWEVPASIDVPKWERAIHEALKEYDVVILEGLFAFTFPEINTYYDKHILVEIPQEVFMARKRADLRWGQEPEWYITYIWEAYHIHGKPKDFEGFRVKGNSPLDVAGLKTYLEI